MLNVILLTLKDLSTISVLFGVFIFIYLLMGLELFAYKLHDPLAESKFDTFLESFLSVFIVLANDGWSTIYFDHVRSLEPISTSLYFVSLVIIGQFVLLNLVIAIIIENFEFQSVKNDLVSQLNNE
jgi:Ion transport protein